MTVGVGKLYKLGDSQYVADVNYQFHDNSASNWWGELTLAEYMKISDNERYTIELEDKRKGDCRLRKRVNWAVSNVVPTRYVYHFTGISPLE